MELVAVPVWAQSGTKPDRTGPSNTNGNQEIVKLLIEKGADINAQGGFYGTALG